MNKIPCKECVHFDPQEKYRGGVRVPTWYAWCRVQSVYPHANWDEAKPFDVDVKRVSKNASVSKPHIIQADGTVDNCPYVVKGSQ